MKNIYILLSRTGTVPSRAIHAIKGGAYTHASIALTPQTDEIYSFARRKVRNFLNAGFVVENIHTQIFAHYPDCECAVYSIAISDSAYSRVRAKITEFKENYDKAIYNFLGLFMLIFNIPIKRRWQYTCSQFVAMLLSLTDEIALPKSPSLMLPCDFMNIEGAKLIYKGRIFDCNLTHGIDEKVQ